MLVDELFEEYKEKSVTNCIGILKSKKVIENFIGIIIFSIFLYLINVLYYFFLNDTKISEWFWTINLIILCLFTFYLFKIREIFKNEYEKKMNKPYLDDKRKQMKSIKDENKDILEKILKNNRRFDSKNIEVILNECEKKTNNKNLESTANVLIIPLFLGILINLVNVFFEYFSEYISNKILVITILHIIVIAIIVVVYIILKTFYKNLKFIEFNELVREINYKMIETE